jgi:hypothetical protein
MLGIACLLVSGQGPAGDALAGPVYDLNRLWQLAQILFDKPWILPAVAAYSLDQLLPIVQLDKAFDEIRLESWTKYYFYAHKLVGWALASFLVAGLAGLTQKGKKTIDLPER